MFLKGFLLIFLIFSASIKAQPSEDPITDSDDENVETDEAEVEEDEHIKKEIVTDITDTANTESENQAIVDGVPVASKNVETEMMFVEPSLNKRSNGAGVELPANRIVKILVSFSNNELQIADQDPKNYKLETIEGFLRYPSDFSYFLQNFTARSLDVTVEPRKQASVEYAFMPAQQLAGRPFGLTLRLAYQDNSGKLYTSTFFNDTVQITELDEGFDTESLFLYVLVLAVLGLGLFGIYHLINVYALKKIMKPSSHSKQTNESSGNSLNSEMDYEWIPKEHLKQRQSPTSSPRNRKSKRAHENNHLTGH